MVESHDILIVGVGTAGTYFGWQMAKRGHSVVIVERDQRDFEVHMTTRKILKIFLTVIMGIVTGNYSVASFKALLRSVLVSGKLRSHYENYPEDPVALQNWVEKADQLWEKAGARMK